MVTNMLVHSFSLVSGKMTNKLELKITLNLTAECDSREEEHITHEITKAIGDRYAEHGISSDNFEGWVKDFRIEAPSTTFTFDSEHRIRQENK